jgi:hypothetical protein
MDVNSQRALIIIIIVIVVLGLGAMLSIGLHTLYRRHIETPRPIKVVPMSSTHISQPSTRRSKHHSMLPSTVSDAIELQAMSARTPSPPVESSPAPKPSKNFLGHRRFSSKNPYRFAAADSESPVRPPKQAYFPGEYSVTVRSYFQNPKGACKGKGNGHEEEDDWEDVSTMGGGNSSYSLAATYRFSSGTRRDVILGREQEARKAVWKEAEEALEGRRVK